MYMFIQLVKYITILFYSGFIVTYETLKWSVWCAPRILYVQTYGDWEGATPPPPPLPTTTTTTTTLSNF